MEDVPKNIYGIQFRYDVLQDEARTPLRFP